MEFDFSQLTPFWEWFPGALANYLVVMVVLTIAVFLLGWIFSVVRHGPIKACWFITWYRQGQSRSSNRRAIWWSSAISS